MTRSIQTVAALLALLALGAATIPFSAKADVTDGAGEPSPEPVKPAETAAPKVEIDVNLLATALNAVSGPVKNQAAPEPAPGETAAAPAATEGLDAWRYLGAIMSSSYKRAIVFYADGQHLLAEGQRVDLNPQPGVAPLPANEVEIVEIAPTYIKVKQGETDRQIDIAPRQRAALNVLDANAVRAANNANAAINGAMGGARSANSGFNGAANGNESAQVRRMRDLERRMADAKSRGDEKTAAALENAMTDVAKEAGKESGKGEKLEKGVK